MASGFSPDGRFLAVGDCTGDVHVWSAETGTHQFSRRVAEPRPGLFMPELALGGDKSAGDLLTGIPVTTVGVSPDGSNLATAAGILSAELRLWDLKTGERKWIVPLAAGVRAVAFSPDGERLAVACGLFPGSSAGVVILDVGSGQELLRIDTAVESLAFSPDGTRLWGIRPKRNLVYWDATPWPSPVNPPRVANRPSVVEMSK
jgi:WD40 repeat protein